MKTELWGLIVDIKQEMARGGDVDCVTTRLKMWGSGDPGGDLKPRTIGIYLSRAGAGDAVKAEQDRGDNRRWGVHEGGFEENPSSGQRGQKGLLSDIRRRNTPPTWRPGCWAGPISTWYVVHGYCLNHCLNGVPATARSYIACMNFRQAQFRPIQVIIDALHSIA